MEEVWKDMVGYESFYQISSTGKVRSKDRTVNAWYGQRVVKGKNLRITSGTYPHLQNVPYFLLDFETKWKQDLETKGINELKRELKLKLQTI